MGKSKKTDVSKSDTKKNTPDASDEINKTDITDENDAPDTPGESDLNDKSNESDSNDEPDAPNTQEEPKEPELYKGCKRFAYIGPALPNSSLKSNAILVGSLKELKEYYKDDIAKYPQVGSLIVPVSRLAKLREQTQRSGNWFYTCYNEVVETIIMKGDKT